MLSKTDTFKRHKTPKQVSIQPWQQRSHQCNQYLIPVRPCSQQKPKKTVNDKIQQIIQKYKRSGFSGQGAKRVTRQTFRQKLRDIVEESEFKQMGEGVQKCKDKDWFSLQLMKRRMSTSNHISQYKNVTLNSTHTVNNTTSQKKAMNTTQTITPKSSSRSHSCNQQFQRMLKLKDNIRRRNTLAVAKLKQKYQITTQNMLYHTQRSHQVQKSNELQSARQKAKIKIKMRSSIKQHRSFYQNNQLQIIGRLSNPAQYQFPISIREKSMVLEAWPGIS